MTRSTVTATTNVVSQTRAGIGTTHAAECTAAECGRIILTGQPSYDAAYVAAKRHRNRYHRDAA